MFVFRHLFSLSRLLALLAVLVVSVVDTPFLLAEDVDFRRDIRPLLSKACFHCHGPDEETREADLRLDTQDGAFADLGGYAAVVPGDAEQSELLNRIASDDPAERMPPAESGEPLTESEIALLRRWIESGAKWAEHWSFVAPTRPLIPEVDQKEWPRNPIDAFVLSHLAEKEVAPSPAADRITELRRLSLDLIGLPPSVEEVDRYLRDNRPDAYEQQVERLLHSPHFGERWGRLWLDAARYADSDGFEKDPPRDVWFYRDWVINAINRDMPYDQFIIEQIAGDLLPEATQSQRVATGFLRNSMNNEEGGIVPEQFRMEAMFDRMDAIGSGILGLTIRCAQCHSHKFDPLSHREYYEMFAFLNNCHEAQVAVYTPPEERQRQAVLAGIRKIELQLQHEHPDWIEKIAAWEDRIHAEEPPEWVTPVLEFDDTASGGQKYMLQDDGSYLHLGYSAVFSIPLMNAATKMQGITAVQLELLSDPNLPFGGPGRSIWGTCAITEFEVFASPETGPGAGERKPVKIGKATADISLAEQPLDKFFDNKQDMKRVVGPIEYAADGKKETAWGIDAGPGRRNQSRKAVFTFAEPVSFPQGATLFFNLRQEHGGWNADDRQANNTGRFRISFTNAPSPVADPIPATVRELLDIPREKRTSHQSQRLFSYWRTTVADWQDANQQIEELWRQHPEGSSQLVLMEREKLRQTHRLDRGNFLNPTEEMSPGVPGFLHPLAEETSHSRLSFAQWLVDRQSPTTARSITNRVWQAYFGVGLVRTSSDLGSQGDAPSHPKLLDWLAVELMDRNWSLKHLHRLIVNSATYRQSSDVSAELLALDPDNRLLARGARHRVDAEIVRDVALFASGLLNPKIGGPSVYPDAPAFLFLPPTSYGPKTWDLSTGAERYRRAVYTFAFRSIPYPSLQTFDAPNGDASCVRRSTSNTPLQALTTLNEPLFVDCAKALALRTVKEKKESDKRLEYAFRRCVARPPTANEREVLGKLLAEQTARFASGELPPEEFVATEDLPEGVSAAELAGWTVVARVLLNLDETISKE